MGRSPCCAKEGLNRGAWTAMEDKILTDYIKANGEGKWRNLPKRAGLKRCGKSCRLRWLNYLRPDIKRGNISADEEELIIRLHKLLGNRWSLIAGRLPGRTDNEIKNYWNTNLSKRALLHTTTAKHLNSIENTARSTPKHHHHHHLGSNISRKKKTNMKSSKNNTILSTNTHKDQVVRTKAVRCTKVFLVDPTPSPTVSSPPLLPPSLAAPPLFKTEAAAAPKKLPVATNVNDVVLPSSSSPFDQTSGMKLPGTAGNSSNYLPTVAETDAPAGMMADSCCLDFNFLELLDSSTYLSDICSFDFSPQQHHLTSAAAGDSHNDNNGIEAGGVMYHHSPSTLSSSEEEVEEQPIVFSEEMMEDWRRSDLATTALSCYDIILYE